MSEDLLTIDVGAELSKVTLGRLRNRSQAVVALARAAASAQPELLVIGISRNGVSISHDGNTPPPVAISSIRTLFDLGHSEYRRHEALERLETLGMLDLLVAFALGASLVELKLGPPLSTRITAHAKGGGLHDLEVTPYSKEAGVELVLKGKLARPGEVADELAEALRHAGFPVELNGKRIDHGLDLPEAILQHRFSGLSFKGVVGIPRQGTAATRRFLVNGVLERESWESHPDGSVYQAVIDMHKADFDPGPALQALRHQVGRLYDRLRDSYDRLEPADQARAKQLLFRMADFGAGAAAVAGVRLFSRVNGEAVDAEDLKRSALGRVVRAVDPSARPDRFVIAGWVFILDNQERGFVEKHLGLQVREPARRPRRRLLGSPARLLDGLEGAFRRLVRGLAGRRIIDEDELSPGERIFIQALDRFVREEGFRHGRVTGAAFARLRFSGWRAGPAGQILLSRGHPRVARMIEAFQRDPRNLYAIAMLLADGRDAFGKAIDQAQEAILR